VQSVVILPSLRYSTKVAITPSTRKEDDRLRKELQHADLEKFKKLLKTAVLPKKKADQEQAKNMKRH
jgi:hypothetical protein